MPALDALADLLTRAAQSAGATARPIAVKEILDTLAPYRQVRAHAIVDTNDDYLLLVMRLLAGEGGFIEAEAAVRSAFAAELAAPNPDLFVVRTHGNATVRLSGARPAAAVAPAVVAPPAVEPVPAPVPAPTPAPAPTTRAEPMPESEPPVELIDVESAASGPACVACAHPLPGDRDVRFCPWCGVDQTIKRCPGCGSELETTWRFCVTCGRQA